MMKSYFALALQGMQATYPTMLVAIITKHTNDYVSTSSQKLTTLKSSTRWEATLAKIKQAFKTNYTKELVTTS
jgi:hypothetical protein